MAAQHLPRYLGGLAVDKRRTRSNEKKKFNWNKPSQEAQSK